MKKFLFVSKSVAESFADDVCGSVEYCVSGNEPLGRNRIQVELTPLQMRNMFR